MQDLTHLPRSGGHCRTVKRLTERSRENINEESIDLTMPCLFICFLFRSYKPKRDVETINLLSFEKTGDQAFVTEITTSG